MRLDRIHNQPNNAVTTPWNLAMMSKAPPNVLNNFEAATQSVVAGHLTGQQRGCDDATTVSTNSTAGKPDDTHAWDLGNAQRQSVRPRGPFDDEDARAVVARNYGRIND